MYISKDGTVLNNKLDQIIDTLTVNMELDIFDTPFYKIGIDRNFSKATYLRSKSYIESMMVKVLENNSLNGVISVKSVNYNESTNLYTIELTCSAGSFTVELEED